MTNEQKILLEILKSALCGEKIQIDSAAQIDWKQIMREASLQAVALITFDALPQIKDIIPPDIYSLWSRTAYSIIANNTRVRASQAALVKLLNKNATAYTILKGEAAAHYYPKPTLRTLGDVDFLINPTEREKVAQLLTADGFTCRIDTHLCHDVFTKGHSHLEMHFDLAGIPEGMAGDMVREFTKDIIPTSVLSESSDEGFKMPAPQLHATVLLLHTEHHLLGEGIGLRHLCDWYCFVKATANQDFWQKDLLPFLKQIGLYKFALTLTELCVNFLGLPAPDWLEISDAALCEQLMDDILSGGNFGVKDSRREISGAMISNRGKKGMSGGKLSNLFVALSASVKQQNPKAKTNRLIFARDFTYRCVRYAVRAATGKKASVLDANQQANQRKNLYKQLKIFEVAKNYGKL